MKSKFSDLFLGVSMSGIALLALAKGVYFVSIFCGGIVLSVAGFKLLLHYNAGNKNFDYQKFKSAFLLTGFAIVFATLTSAFNYSVPNVITQLPPPLEFEYERVEVIPPITKHEEPERQEAPPPIDKDPKLNVIIDPIDIKDVLDKEPVVIVTDPPKKNVKTVYVPPKDKEPIDIPIDEPDLTEDIIVDFAEKMPEFPGGEKELLKFLSTNIKYPEFAKENGEQGRVFIQFIVEKDGSISDVEVLRDIKFGCGEEAARVVEMMPNWKPGKQGGKNVRVRYKLPVKFKLE